MLLDKMLTARFGMDLCSKKCMSWQAFIYYNHCLLCIAKGLAQSWEILTVLHYNMEYFLRAQHCHLKNSNKSF